MIINFNIGKGGGGLTPEQERKLDNLVQINKYNEDKDLQIIVDESQNESIQEIEDNLVISVNEMKGDVKVFKTWRGSQEEFDSIPIKNINIFYCIGDFEDYFGISAIEDCRVIISGGGSSISLEYSFDKLNWSTFSRSSYYSVSKGTTIYLKGINSYLSRNTLKITGGKTELTGNIMSLLYGDDYRGKTVLSSEDTFESLFQNNTTIVSIDKLKLPATTLTSGCYKYMFKGCTGLTSIPENFLPTTTLGESCYNSMFSGCTGLTSIPETLLPATSLKWHCYAYMFENCSGLTSIPEKLLPTTTIDGTYCYVGMFRGCKKLTSIPEKLLPATTIDEDCYEKMFENCIGLKSIPEKLLPATTLKRYCYQAMFRGCTGLKSIPENFLPATKLDWYCYNSMFSGCTGLETIPENLLPSESVTYYCYRYMFDGCTNLKNTCILPSGHVFDEAYKGMFRNCTSLIEAKPIFLTYVYREDQLQEMFKGCTNLKSVTVGFTSISSSGKISTEWLSDVAERGNINIPSDATWDTTVERSESGIPESWTITKI